LALSNQTLALLQHLAGRPGHDEVKADFREILIQEFGAERHEIDFERQQPIIRGRIDALIGRTVFEAKRNLEKEWTDVQRRMPDYLADRERETGERFVGIASDGARWVVMELRDGLLEIIKETLLDLENPETFIAWLDGALALKSSLPPEPLTIRMELGGDSVAYRRASQELRSVWQSVKDRPDTMLKRQLWAAMLKLVYGRDIDDDDLWIQHTYLVIVAKSIALAVLDLSDDEPAQMLSGNAFERANIRGAVESDFFDWVVASQTGETLVRRIMAHVRRFRLREVETDVLKILYESLIDASQRHGLGEYYTPDWLAAKVIRNIVDVPHQQKVLDPACGSGTFLFHAIRRFLSDAEEIDFPKEGRAAEATNLVTGMDIHPVAVIIARVTYLLALAPVIGMRKGDITIPVYLGDAMQLSIDRIFTDTELKIQIPPPRTDVPETDGQLRHNEFLSFPECFCRIPELFDRAVFLMRDASNQNWSRTQYETAVGKSVTSYFGNMSRMDSRWEEPWTDERERGVTMLGDTFIKLDRLAKQGRDTIWTYIARNLSRPLFLSSRQGWANVIVGNPPWVAYRHMSADLQKRFKDLAKGERVYVGGKLTTQNDLCALFTVRAAQLYLRPGGRLGFVLPLAALTRGQYEKFRSGNFESVKLRFDETWTMDDSVHPLFPVPSCAVFVTKRKFIGQDPAKIIRRAYSGFLPLRDAPEDMADAKLKVDHAAGDPSTASFEGGSPYRAKFKQGATLVPRFLCFVERKQMGRLGSGMAKPAINSRRSSQEKAPWKNLPALEGNVEAEFLRPVLLGESILPYRVFAPLEAVIPVNERGKMLSAKGAADEGFDGLANWMRKAEAVWENNATESNALRLVERWNYHGGVTSQFPIMPLRFVYTKAGSQAAACLVEGPFAIDHKLYWIEIRDKPEGHYLAALMNSEKTRSLIEHLQSKGQWGARDFDKVMFNLPIPLFNAAQNLHTDLAQAAAEAESFAATVALDEGMVFTTARKRVREALADAGLSTRIDGLVAKLLNA
jgi:hypothetical protein